MTYGKKIALVTGGNRGLGLGICGELAKKGIKVILTARDEAKGRQAVNSLLEMKGEVIFHQLDVTNEQSILTLTEYIEKNHGYIDILVNNAGMIVEEDFRQPGSQLSLDAVKQTMELNFYGPLRVTQALIPLIKRTKGGRIINISARNSFLSFAFSGWLAYKASKACLNAMTVDLAKELEKDNIAVNAVHPGWVDTDTGRYVGGGKKPTLTIQEGAQSTI
ncbi:MAG: 3-oxoacyl-[acyl-carrier-protein] reductase FabG [Candidatus Heimdallarchaeota archaeon LC_3]|nr:MAG: 3-oxoacyl-[acyl-carrier-protein] reductase FabG [Candidatus Heimdallarchaeota archaeon LC_3]